MIDLFGEYRLFLEIFCILLLKEISVVLQELVELVYVRIFLILRHLYFYLYN